MKQDLATAYRQMKEPKYPKQEESVKLIHEAKRAKEK